MAGRNIEHIILNLRPVHGLDYEFAVRIKILRRMHVFVEVKSEAGLAGVQIETGQISSRAVVMAIDTQNVVVLLDGLDDNIVALPGRYLGWKIAHFLFK